MKSRHGVTFAEEGKWTSGADSTLLVGDWQAWVDSEGHWKVRGPDPDNEAHYADGDIELTEAEYIEAGNSEARRKIRARRAKEAARTYIKTMTRPSKRHHATKKSPAQLQREIDEVLVKPVASALKIRLPPGEPAAWAHSHFSKANTPDELAEIWRVMRKPWTGMGVYYASRTGIAQSEIDSVYQQHRARLGAS
jgi:hypothetical protein